MSQNNQSLFGNSNLSTIEKNVIIKTQIDPIVKSKTDAIKQENIEKNKIDISATDRKCQHIIEIANRFEELYHNWGYPFMISDICHHVVHLFYNVGLEKDVTYVYQSLPDIYKNKSKGEYKYMESKLYVNQIKRNMANIDSIDLSKLDAASIRELRKASISQVDRFQLELENRNEPIEEEQYNQFEELKAAEDQKFQKSEISSPLATPDELCKDPEYEAAFNEVKRELDQTVSNAEKMRKLFTEEYPPLSVASCKKLASGFHDWNEFFKPYTDEKYRSDHINSIKVSFTKILETSTKASKDSRIACAYTVDKNGLPVMRGLTKEQIDSMYVPEVNFWTRIINTYFGWGDNISDIFKEHKARNLADRAVQLGPHLSHHS